MTIQPRLGVKDTINFWRLDIMRSMKQMLTRLDDRLHDRLKAQAAAEGRSMNDLVTAILNAAVEDAHTRSAVRARARAAGMLVVPDKPRSAPTYAELVAASEGAGTAASEALAAERESR